MAVAATINYHTEITETFTSSLNLNTVKALSPRLGVACLAVD